MSHTSLQERLVRYFEKRPGEKIAKAAIADLARDKMGVTGETVGRRLRVLVEASTMSAIVAERTSPEHVMARKLLAGSALMVEYREKRHSWYWLVPAGGVQTRREVVVVDGVAREIIRTIN